MTEVDVVDAAAAVVAVSAVVAAAADLAEAVATPRKMAALGHVVAATDSAMAEAADLATETADAAENDQDQGLDLRLGERVLLQSTVTIRMDIKCLFDCSSQGSKSLAGIV